MGQDRSLARCVVRRQKLWFTSCVNATQLSARTRHYVRMQPFFEMLTPIQQAAFILGCEVDTENGCVVATQSEDLINRALVEALWDFRRD